MKKFLVFLFFAPIVLFAQQEPADEIAIQLTRDYSRELFDMNGVPFSQPMVEATNTTSNARFYNRAWVPKKVDKPYFRISVNTMVGFVTDEMKEYVPSLPAEEFDLNDAGRYGTVDLFNQTFNITDTAGLVLYFFKNLVYDGLEDGTIVLPEKTASILGFTDEDIYLNDEDLQALAEQHPLWQFLPEEYQDDLLEILDDVPEFFSLPEGGNIDQIVAPIPQVEIGSLFGTELLIRYIPRINLGENIGDFTFWGFGLRHSISQYFGEAPPFDMAIQAAYQGTNLKNSIGVTESQMESDATFYNLNLHASKSIENWFDVYFGIGFESVDITADFTYVLPQEMQIALGLWQPGQTEPTEEYPGDNVPQTSKIVSDDQNFKLTLGLFKEFYDFGIYADFSIRDFGVDNFNIFTFGLQYTINNPEYPDVNID